MKNSNLNKLFSTAAILGALAAPAVAQEEAADADVSVAVTLDYVTNYFFRGAEQYNTDSGLTFQPGATATFGIGEGVSAYVGTWNSISTDQPTIVGGTGDAGPGNWYEMDLFAGIDATFGDFTAGVGLTYYTYPSNLANIDITELNLKLGYDDSDVLGDWAFNPYVAMAIELQDNSGTLGEGIYLEFGGAFSLDSLTGGTFAEDWSWSVPIVVGLGLDHYYANSTTGSEETFGYVKTGLAGSIALSELIGYEDWFGAWDLNLGLDLYFLNGDAGLEDSGSEFQAVGKIGISRTW